MKAEKDTKTGKWLIQYRYKDWTGKLRKSTKRGFNTKREAEEWLRNFLQEQKPSFDMKFSSFVPLYLNDMRNRLREHMTMHDWETRLNAFIQMFEYGLLKDAGKVNAEIARLHALSEFEKYRVIQDRIFMSDYDRFLLEMEAQKEGKSM